MSQALYDQRLASPRSSVRALENAMVLPRARHVVDFTPSSSVHSPLSLSPRHGTNLLRIKSLTASCPSSLTKHILLSSLCHTSTLKLCA